MTPEDAREHYPGAARLVHLFETNETIQHMIRMDREESVSPERFITEQVQDMRKRLQRGWGGAAEVIEQMQHPDFLKYIRAKLGGM